MKGKKVLKGKPLVHQFWTEEDYLKLVSAVEKHGSDNYRQHAKLIPERTASQIKTKILREKKNMKI